MLGAVVLGESSDLSGADNTLAPGGRALGAGLPSAPASRSFPNLSLYECRRAPHIAREGSRAPLRRAAVDASAAALILTAIFSRTNHG